MTATVRRLHDWPQRMMCYACRRLGVHRRAVVRAFSGEIHGGEGWPACEGHRAAALRHALGTLMEEFIDPAKWRVTIYDVIADDHDDPKLKLSFTARRKIT